MKHVGGLPNFETQKPGPHWVIYVDSIIFFLFWEFVGLYILLYSFMTQKPKKMSLLVGFFEGHLRVTSWHVCCFALPGTWRAHNMPRMLWAQRIAPRGIKGHVSRKMIGSFYQLIPESIWCCMNIWDSESVLLYTTMILFNTCYGDL